MRRQSKILSESEAKSAVSSYQNGESVTDIARRLGVSHTSIYNHLKKAGVERDISIARNKKNSRWVTDEEAARIVEMYKAGVSVNAIRKATGRAEPTVYDKLHKAGVIKKKTVYARISPEELEQLNEDIDLIEEVAEFFTKTELAEKFDVSLSGMTEFLRRNAIISKKDTSTCGRKKLQMTREEFDKLMDQAGGSCYVAAGIIGVHCNTIRRVRRDLEKLSNKNSNKGNQ